MKKLMETSSRYKIMKDPMIAVGMPMPIQSPMRRSNSRISTTKTSIALITPLLATD